MADMVSFSVAMLTALSDFMTTGPMFYLFALICFCFIVRAVKILIT